ncbi:hypothetical protein ES702_01579 [subsurface metagenome]
MLRDPTSDTTFKSWPKPLTIEYLEEQYRLWLRDLTSFCWVDEAVRDLGGEGMGQGVGGQGQGQGIGTSPVHGGGHQLGTPTPGGTGLGGRGDRDREMVG